MDIVRENEYSEKGDYHKQLDKDWPFYPVYLAKMKLVEEALGKIGKDKKIVDLGCGEGELVEKFKKQGYDILGVDLNYQSDLVKKGDITATGFSNNEFDVVLCLCVLEHMPYEQQERALDEIKRILKPGGTLILTLSNLAHFASRLSFLFTGKLIRTSEPLRHPGDRPISEYLLMLKNRGFETRKRRGLFPTFPISSFLTNFFPARMVGWHKILNLFAWPNWSFLNFVICQKK